MDINTTLNPPLGRGCGDRKEGEPYLCLGLSKRGFPMTHFIPDPIPPREWQRGFALVRAPEGHNDLMVYIGREYYPSAWSFVEEVGAYGLSRKMSEDFPFHEITPGRTRLYIVHPRAIPKFPYRVPSGNNSPRLHNCKWFNPEAESRAYYREDWDWTTPGYHPPAPGEEPCAFALRNLSALFHAEDAPIEIQTGSGTPKTPLIWCDHASSSWMIFPPDWVLEPHTNWRDHADELERKQYWDSGIIMRLPFSHIEFPGGVPEGMAEKMNDADIPYVEMEY